MRNWFRKVFETTIDTPAKFADTDLYDLISYILKLISWFDVVFGMVKHGIGINIPTNFQQNTLVTL